MVDKWGNMVTYTNTIESSHGIGVFAGYRNADGSFRNFGFLLNNELTDFNTTPSTNPYTGSAGYNDVQPNKRPRSSMNPTMIFTPDGEPLIAYGSPGGATIINSVLNVTLNLIDHKMTLQDAIDAPRLSITWPASTISIETGVPAVHRSRLLPHARASPWSDITTPAGEIGSVQAVLVDPDTGQSIRCGRFAPRRHGDRIAEAIVRLADSARFPLEARPRPGFCLVTPMPACCRLPRSSVIGARRSTEPNPSSKAVRQEHADPRESPRSPAKRRRGPVGNSYTLRVAEPRVLMKWSERH